MKKQTFKKYPFRPFAALLCCVLLSAGCSLFSKQPAAGVVKTVNGGTDWQLSNKMAGSKTSALANASISKMFFDPSNRETVFAGSFSGGLYKSTDSGVTWKLILSNIVVHDAVINPADTKTIYVAGYYGDHGRVVVTHDDGGSWNQIFNEESTQNPVRAIAINPANSQQLIIGTSSGELIRSSDGGQNWQMLHNYVDKFDELSWRPSGLYALLRQKGLMKSMDGGMTFQTLTEALSPTQKEYVFGRSDNPVSAYFRFYISPTDANTMYVTADSGVFKSVDGGVTWNKQRLPVKDGSQEAHGIAASETSLNVVYVGSGATVYKSVDGGASWQTQKVATTGVINYILIDPQLPQIVYAGVYTGE